MALGNITLRSTSSSSVVNLKANVDATIDIVNRPLTHEEVDLNFLELGHSIKANQLTNFTTSDLAEGTRLYYTTARVGAYLSGTAKLGDLSDVAAPTASDDKYHMYYDHSTASIKFGNFSSTDYLPEGATNKYYTDARFDTRLAAKSTTNLSEGTNLYYTDARWDTRLGTKTTADLTEGSNLYFTNARADARADVRIAASSINALSDVDTTGIATNKILKWTGTNWTIADLTTSTLSGLTDTTISGASNGQVLKYNGSAWVNSSDSTDWNADLKANTLTSSTDNIKVATYSDKNITVDLTSNASIVSNAATAVGDIISTAYANGTSTDINAAVNMSDIKIKNDFLSGITLLQNTNNANVSVDTGANLNTYHFAQNGNACFNIALFNSSHKLHQSYVTGEENGSMWQFKTMDRSSNENAEARVTIFAGDARGKIIHENRAYDNTRRFIAKTVSGVTQANPGVVTATGHNFIDGETVAFAGVVGMTQLNGNSYEVANKTANTFELKGTDTTGFTAYASGGTVSLNDAQAFGATNVEYTGNNFTITADGALNLKPTGKLDIGATPGHFNATTQARIQKSISYFGMTGVDNTQRHYNEGHGNKITFGANVDSANRKQGVLTDCIFDLNGFTFGADNPTNIYRMLGGTYDWTTLQNTGGSAKTVSGMTSRHVGAEVSGGARNLTVTNLAGLTALASLDDATSSVTNLAAIIAHTGNDNGTATNRYSIYAPEASDKAHFEGEVHAGWMNLKPTAHGSLPGSPSQGDVAFLTTDSSSATKNKPVYYDGTNWRYFNDDSTI